MTHKHSDIANTYAGKACKVYTVDGTKEANICGRLHPFANIVALDGTVRIEVSWPTVARKMESDGLFYAC